MTLSERFEQMAAANAKRVIMKPVTAGGAFQRRDEMDSRRKVGRQTQFDARRQGLTNTKSAMRTAQAKVVVPRQQSQQQRQNFVQGRGRGRALQAGGGRTGTKTVGMPPRGINQKVAGRGAPAGRGAGRTGGRGNVTGGRVAGRGGRGGRGGKTGGRGTANKKPEEPKNLDEGLDEYWFKAGKGPDPKVASLDRSMDSYWSKADAAKTSSGGAAVDKMDADTPAVPAPVAGVDPDL